jgi:hypothetical protein
MGRMDWLETSRTMESREGDYCMLNIRGTIDVQNESQESVGNLATG